MNTTTRYTAENIICRPIDKEKLSRDLDARIHAGDPGDPKTYDVTFRQAIVLEPRPAILNEEFIGHGGGKYIIRVWGECKEGDTTYMDCLPSHAFEFDLTDIVPYLLPPVTLAEFTKARRGYNPRIRDNEYDFIQYFNGGN